MKHRRFNMKNNQSTNMFFSVSKNILLFLLVAAISFQPVAIYAMTQSAMNSVVNNREDYDECSGSEDQAGDTNAQTPAGITPDGTSISNINITVYSPQSGGDKVQGGLSSSDAGPDGEFIVRTVDDYRNGRSTYVTIAGNKLFKNKQYIIPSLPYVDITGTDYTLTNVPVVVHDTGGAFTFALEGRFDVPIGIDYPTGSSGVLYRQPINGKNKIQMIPFTGEIPASGGASASPAQPSTPVQAMTGSTSTPKTPVKKVSDMTLREKVATMVFARAFSENDVNSLKTGGAGGIFARPNDANDTTFFKGLKGFLGDYNGFVAVDFEGGRVQAPGSGVAGEVPSAQELGKKTEEEITTTAKTAGQKISDLGINMNFAPVVDIGGTNTSAIGDRAFANDAEGVAKKAGAFAEGMSQSNVVSVFKHFPGHGSKEGDSHSGAVSTAGLSELEGRDIVPYQTLKGKAKSAIMMGHLKVPDWGETPTSINSAAYTYLRDGVSYDGVVITDALDMAGLGSPADEPSRALLAIKAGADVALLNSPGAFGPTADKLEQAVGAGEINEESINASVERILKLRSAVNTEDTAIDAISCTPCQPPAESGASTIPIDGENPKRMFDFLVEKQLTPEQAAGITGNSMAESGESIDPTADNSGNYYGIFQWDTGGRYANLVSWANQNGKSLTDKLFETQLEYAWKEATDRGNIEGLKNLAKKNSPSEDVALATWYWGRYFEVAIVGGSTSDEPLTNVQHLDKRTNYAQSVFDKYSGSAPGGASATNSGCDQPTESGGQCTGNTAIPLPVDEVPWTFNRHNHNRTISLPNTKSGHGPLLKGDSQHLAGTNADPSILGEATDVFVTVGTTAFAPFDGEVVFTGGSFNGVIIKSNSGDCVAALAHISTNLSVGDKVTAGQTAGEVDSAGHLHFELWVNGQVINIGKDEKPCEMGGSCIEGFEGKAEEIWKKQKTALTGG